MTMTPTRWAGAALLGLALAGCASGTPEWRHSDPRANWIEDVHACTFEAFRSDLPMGWGTGRPGEHSLSEIAAYGTDPDKRDQCLMARGWVR
jgi:hypothetical protein